MPHPIWVKFGRKDELSEHGRRGGVTFLVSINEIAFMLLPLDFPNIHKIPITEAEIKNIVSSNVGRVIPSITQLSIIVSSLKPKNSSVYDEITSKILETCASIISFPLSYIWNYSLHRGICPDRLKFAVVKPLYKKEASLVFQL